MFKNISVIDLSTGIAGPYCTKILSDLGANVIKVEPPEGDITRISKPFFNTPGNVNQSIKFSFLNTNKKSITLDLFTSSGLSLAENLIRTIKPHLIVENYGPGGLQKSGLSFETIQSINGFTSLVSISNFGSTGPYRNYKAMEINLQAVSGLMSITGEPDAQPLIAGADIAQLNGGQVAALSCLTYLYKSILTSVGTHADISLMEANIDLLENWMLGAFQGQLMPRRGKRHQSGFPSEVYPCSDGYVSVNASPGPWSEMAELMEDTSLDREEYHERSSRPKYRDQIEPLMTKWLDKNKKKEIFHGAQKRRLAFSYIANARDLLESDQLIDRRFFSNIGTNTHPGTPFKIESTVTDSKEAPSLGEHNQEIYEDLLGIQQDNIRTLVEEKVI
ncbi:MAG: CoA:oxalate CoA-transferase [Chloroflexi bacterium]|jgi:crotonobetainyl-CoA:carnitine CoA-transferase CaiB-like acyl-CoA transferase|nr:MAG: CoA:oxalate CoA-transferase [Chloroflexota bacterium]